MPQETIYKNYAPNAVFFLKDQAKISRQSFTSALPFLQNPCGGCACGRALGSDGKGGSVGGHTLAH
jgi:hypothetical protein